MLIRVNGQFIELTAILGLNLSDKMIRHEIVKICRFLIKNPHAN